MPHTPGPWIAEQVLSDGEYDICLDYQVAGAGNPVLIASTYEDEDNHPVPARDAAANARLMAAAPDLLAALQGVLRVADRATVEFDAARAAIKKATK